MSILETPIYNKPTVSILVVGDGVSHTRCIMYSIEE